MARIKQIAPSSAKREALRWEGASSQTTEWLGGQKYPTLTQAMFKSRQDEFPIAPEHRLGASSSTLPPIASYSPEFYDGAAAVDERGQVSFKNSSAHTISPMAFVTAAEIPTDGGGNAAADGTTLPSPAQQAADTLAADAAAQARGARAAARAAAQPVAKAAPESTRARRLQGSTMPMPMLQAAEQSWEAAIAAAAATWAAEAGGGTQDAAETTIEIIFGKGLPGWPRKQKAVHPEVVATANRSFLLACAGVARKVGIALAQIKDAAIELRPGGRPGWVGKVTFNTGVQEQQAKDAAAVLQASVDHGQFNFASGVLSLSCGSGAVTAPVRVKTEMVPTACALIVPFPRGIGGKTFASLTAEHHKAFALVFMPMFQALTGLTSADVSRLQLKEDRPGVLAVVLLDGSVPLERAQAASASLQKAIRSRRFNFNIPGWSAINRERGHADLAVLAAITTTSVTSSDFGAPSSMRAAEPKPCSITVSYPNGFAGEFAASDLDPDASVKLVKAFQRCLLASTALSQSEVNTCGLADSDVDAEYPGSKFVVILDDAVPPAQAIAAAVSLQHTIEAGNFAFMTTGAAFQYVVKSKECTPPFVGSTFLNDDFITPSDAHNRTMTAMRQASRGSSRPITAKDLKLVQERARQIMKAAREPGEPDNSVTPFLPRACSKDTDGGKASHQRPLGAVACCSLLSALCSLLSALCSLLSALC